MNPIRQLEAFTLILTALEDKYLPSLKPKARKKFFDIMDAPLRSAGHLVYPVSAVAFDPVKDGQNDTTTVKVLRRAMLHYYGENFQIPNKGAGKIPEWANDCAARTRRVKRAPKKIGKFK